MDENQVEGLVDKVEDIEEEFANKLEQHEKDMQTSFKESEETITRLEKNYVL